MGGYLKTWMGTSAYHSGLAGSGMGDSSGFLERQYALIHNIDELVKSYSPDAQYYELKLMNVAPVVEAVRCFEHQNDEPETPLIPPKMYPSPVEPEAGQEE